MLPGKLNSKLCLTYLTKPMKYKCLLLTGLPFGKSTRLSSVISTGRSTNLLTFKTPLRLKVSRYSPKFILVFSYTTNRASLD
jgi:hypothetical protein